MSEQVKSIDAPIEEAVSKNEKIMCSCKKQITKNNMASHLKTESHLENCPEDERKEIKKKEAKKLSAILDSINEKLDALVIASSNNDKKMDILFEMIEDLHIEFFGNDEDEQALVNKA